VDQYIPMRFRGGSVSHMSTQEATNRFLADHDPKDVHAVVAASDAAMVVDGDVDESDEDKQEHNDSLVNESGTRGAAMDDSLEEEGGLDDDEKEKGGLDNDKEEEGGLDNEEEEQDEEEMDEGSIQLDEELDYGYHNQGSDDEDENEERERDNEELPEDKMEELGYARY